jgi:CheY-like chemotaxis protein
MNELHDALDGEIRFDGAIIDAMMISEAPHGVLERIRRNAAIVTAILPHPGESRLAARSRALGISRFVTRPVSEDELRDAFRAEPTPLLLEGSAPQPNSQRLSILVVDDERVNLEVTAGLLKRLGHEVRVAGSAGEALASMRTVLPELLMLDVQMPDIDGLRLTELIREEERSGGRARVPIVAVTGHAVKGYREVCIEHGMDDYMTKPVRMDQLRSIVEGVITRFYTDTAAGRGAASAAGTHGDIQPELLRKISRVFLENYPLMLSGIRDALNAGDAPALADVAHRLKGSISNFHAPSIFATAERLEMLGRKGNLTEAKATLEDLSAELERFRPLLEATLQRSSAIAE